MRWRNRLFLASGLLLGLASSAFAQTPAPAPEGTPVRLRGTIDAVTADAVNLTTREGQKVTVKVPADLRVNTVVRVPLTDIKAEDYVGVGWARGADGKPQALEVTVFPPAQRGAGEGTRPFDLVPQSTMTNATIAAVAAASDGKTLKLASKDGELEIRVPANTPIVTGAAGDRSLLKPGAYVVTTARKLADGTLTTQAITAEKDGVKPPN